MASKYSEEEQFEAYIKKSMEKSEKKDLIRKLKEIINFLERSI